MRSTLPHRRLWLQAAASLVAATTLPAGAQVRPKPTVDSAGYTEIRWDDLVPKGWDPTQLLKDKGGGNLAALQDGDPKAAALLQQLREVWDNAPTEPELNNSRIKLPGHLVPLEEVAPIRRWAPAATGWKRRWSSATSPRPGDVAAPAGRRHLVVEPDHAAG